MLELAAVGDGWRYQLVMPCVCASKLLCSGVLSPVLQ